jgi:hypothetical protein
MHGAQVLANRRVEGVVVLTSTQEAQVAAPEVLDGGQL